MTTEPKKISIFIAISETGDFQISEDSYSDAINELESNYGYEACRIIALNVNVDLPTVETVDVTLPPETKAPAQVTVS